MDPRSEAMLAHVHPDLARVMRCAAQDPQPWEVIYGIRTLAAEAAAVASGHSQTLHSRHLADPAYGGCAMAVDVAPIIGGRISFAAGDEAEVYGQLARQVLAAASSLNIQVQWGGAAVGAWTDGVVSNFRDWGHFQLDRERYP